MAKLLHTMIRVFDLAASVRFYEEVFGMKKVSESEYPAGKFTLVFMGYTGKSDETTIELTYNWDPKERYTHGSGFGHLCFGVDDIHKVCEKAREMGYKITREPGPFGSVVLAFMEDPDGYKIELIQN